MSDGAIFDESILHAQPRTDQRFDVHVLIGDDLILDAGSGVVRLRDAQNKSVTLHMGDRAGWHRLVTALLQSGRGIELDEEETHE